MRKLCICLLLFGLSIGNAYTQTYSKSFMFNNLNTLPMNISVISNKLYITGAYPDTSTSIGIGISSFIAKYSSNGLIDTYRTYRPTLYQNFIGSYYNTKTLLVKDKIATIGYSEDTVTGNRSYLINFYDTNAILTNYFVYPTGIPNGGISAITFANHHYYACGSKASLRRPVIIKADTFGNKIFERDYYITPIETPTDVNTSQSITATDSGDLIVAINSYKEYSLYPDLHNKIYKTILLKVDSLGNEKWRWIDTSNNGQAAFSFQKTRDGGYVSCGSYIGYREITDTTDFSDEVGYIIKWRSDLTKEWERKYQNTSSKHIYGKLYDVIEDANGNFIACGYYADESLLTGVNGWLLKTDSNGNVKWSREYRSYQYLGTFDKHFLYDLDILSGGDIVAVGELNPLEPDSIPQQGWLLRVDSNGCVVDSNWCGYDNIEIDPTYSVAAYNILEMYPNPSSQIINLKMNEFGNLKMSEAKIEIYDAMGRAILQQKIATSQEQPIGFRNDSQGNDLSLEINVRSFNLGLYFVRILDKSNNLIVSGKFVKN